MKAGKMSLTNREKNWTIITALWKIDRQFKWFLFHSHAHTHKTPIKRQKKSSQFSPSHSEFICSFSCSHTAIIWILKSATKKKNEFVENWKVKSLFLIVLISCHSVQRYLTRRTLLAQTTNNNEPRKQNAAQETISISFQFDWHLC